MPKFWKERAGANPRQDFMGTYLAGYSNSIGPPRDNLTERWVFLVSVCSFTFEFASLAQIEECLAYFSKKTHPSSAGPYISFERYWQSWDQRLPHWLFEEAKRQKIVKALQRALIEFG